MISAIGLHSQPRGKKSGGRLPAVKGPRPRSGARSAPLTTGFRPPTPKVVVNPNWKAGMFSSVRAGLAAASASSTHFAISPADLPFLSKGTLRTVIDAATSPGADDKTVVVPTFHRRRGHPLVIPAALRARLLSWPDTARLNLLFEEKDLSVLHLEGFDESILHDVDIPRDLSVFSK